MRFHSYVNSAVAIIEQYKGEMPFSAFLKKYFSEHKKYGTTDRKQIAHLCYCCFRLGKAPASVEPSQVPELEESILMGLFLCSREPTEILKQLKPAWSDEVTRSLRDKCPMLNAQFSIFKVFPWK